MPKGKGMLTSPQVSLQLGLAMEKLLYDENTSVVGERYEDDHHNHIHIVEFLKHQDYVCQQTMEIVICFQHNI